MMWDVTTPDPCLNNWQFSRQFLNEGTPSRKDNIPLKKETSMRRLALAFVHDVGVSLKMNQYTIATAFVYWHRFFTVQSLAKNDPYLIAAACLLLAGKVEENFKSLQKITESAYFVRNKRDPKASESLRTNQRLLLAEMDRVVKAEEVLLMTMNFEFIVSHPYRPLLVMFKALGFNDPTSDVDFKRFCQIAWNFANDSFRTTICLQPVSSSDLAATCLDLAANILHIRIPPAPDGRPWYTRWNVKPEVLKDLEFQVMAMYKKKDGDSKTSPNSKVSLPATPAHQPSLGEPHATGTPSPTSPGEGSQEGQFKGGRTPSVPAERDGEVTHSVGVAELNVSVSTTTVAVHPVLDHEVGLSDTSAAASQTLSTVKVEEAQLERSMAEVKACATMQPEGSVGSLSVQGVREAGDSLVRLGVGVQKEAPDNGSGEGEAINGDPSAADTSTTVSGEAVKGQAVSVPDARLPERGLGRENFNGGSRGVGVKQEPSLGGIPLASNSPASLFQESSLLNKEKSPPSSNRPGDNDAGDGPGGMEVDMDVSDDERGSPKLNGPLEASKTVHVRLPVTTAGALPSASELAVNLSPTGSPTLVEAAVHRNGGGCQLEVEPTPAATRLDNRHEKLSESSQERAGRCHEGSVLDISEELMNELEDVEVGKPGGTEEEVATVDVFNGMGRSRKWDKDEARTSPGEFAEEFLQKGGFGQTADPSCLKIGSGDRSKVKGKMAGIGQREDGHGVKTCTSNVGVSGSKLEIEALDAQKDVDLRHVVEEIKEEKKGQEQEDVAGIERRWRQHGDSLEGLVRERERDRERKRKQVGVSRVEETDGRRYCSQEELGGESPGSATCAMRNKDRTGESSWKWKGRDLREEEAGQKSGGVKAVNGHSRGMKELPRKRQREHRHDKDAFRCPEAGFGVEEGDECSDYETRDGRRKCGKGGTSPDVRHGSHRSFLRHSELDRNGMKGSKAKDWPDHSNKGTGWDYARQNRDTRDALRERSRG